MSSGLARNGVALRNGKYRKNRPILVFFYDFLRVGGQAVGQILASVAFPDPA